MRIRSAGRALQPRREAACHGRRLAAAAALLILAAAVSLPSSPALAQSGQAKHVPEAQRPERQTGLRLQDAAQAPDEIGQLLEAIDTARQSGLASIRQIRRVSDVLYGFLYHLRICVVENNTLGIASDRENAALLYELFKETNPSVLLRAELDTLRAEVAKGGAGDPLPYALNLELAVERYTFLWPLQDLPSRVRAITELQQNGKTEDCLEAIRAMDGVLGLPNIDGPIAWSAASYHEGEKLLDAGKQDAARQRFKDAASYISQLNVGTFLVETSWHLGKSADALLRGQGNLSLVSLRYADTTLKSAEEASWKEFKPSVTAVRADTRRIIDTLNDRAKKITLTRELIRSIARRIDTELRITN